MEGQHIQDSDRRRTTSLLHEQWQAPTSTQIAHSSLSQEHSVDATWRGEWPNVEHDLGLYGNTPWQSTVALDQFSPLPFVHSDQLDMPLDEFWNDPSVEIPSGDNLIPQHNSSVPNSLNSSVTAYMGASAYGGSIGSTSLSVGSFGPDSMNAIPLEPHVPNANAHSVYLSPMADSEYASAMEIDNSMLQSSVLYPPLQYGQQNTMPGLLTQDGLVHGDFANQGTIPCVDTSSYHNRQFTRSKLWQYGGASAEFSENLQSSMSAHEPVINIRDSLAQDPVDPQPTIATSVGGLPALVEQQPSPSAPQQPKSKLPATQSRQRPLAPRGSIKASESRISKPRGGTGTNRFKQSTIDLTANTSLDYPGFQTVFHQDSNTQILPAKKRGKYNKKACWMCQLDRKGCIGGTTCDRCQAWRQKAESESNWRKESAILSWTYCFDLDIESFKMFEGMVVSPLIGNPTKNLMKKFRSVLLSAIKLVRTIAGSTVDLTYMYMVGRELFQRPVPCEVDKLIQLCHLPYKAVHDESTETTRHSLFDAHSWPRSSCGANSCRASLDDPVSFHGIHLKSVDLIFVAINIHNDYLCAETNSTSAEMAAIRTGFNCAFFKSMQAFYKDWKSPKSSPEHKAEAEYRLSRYVGALRAVEGSSVFLDRLKEFERIRGIDFKPQLLVMLVFPRRQWLEVLFQSLVFCAYLGTSKGLYHRNDFRTRLSLKLQTAIVDFEVNRDTAVTTSLYRHTEIQLNSPCSMAADPSQAAEILNDMIAASKIAVNDDDDPWQPFERLLKHSNGRFKHLAWSPSCESYLHSVSR